MKKFARCVLILILVVIISGVGGYFYEDKSDRIIDDDVLARLLSFNYVIVTSHQAFFTREAVHNIAETTLQNIADFEAGLPLENLDLH